MTKIFRKNSQTEKSDDWGVTEKIIYLYEKHCNTLRSRIFLAITFWFIYFIFYIIIIKYDYSLSLLPSSIFALRNILIGICYFYLLTYISIPHFFLKKRFLAFAASLLILFFINSNTNYLCSYVIYHYIELRNSTLTIYVKKMEIYSLHYIFSIKNIIEMFIMAFYVASFPILFKLSFDFMISVNKKAKLEREKVQLEKENLLLELNLLKSQLNPHFLFNALNSIYSLSYHKDDRASGIILKLSDLLQYTLYEANTETVCLEREIIFLLNFIELERARNKNNKHTSIELNTEFNEDEIKNVRIAPMLLFNFVENAFKHGLGSIIFNAWVKIFIGFKNKILSLSVKNSYNSAKTADGFNKEYVGGIGIENTRKRLLLLYPDKHKLEIVIAESTYKVLLTINLG
jgi:sensor histidine kinase YesM